MTKSIGYYLESGILSPEKLTMINKNLSRLNEIKQEYAESDRVIDKATQRDYYFFRLNLYDLIIRGMRAENIDGSDFKRMKRKKQASFRQLQDNLERKLRPIRF